VLRRRARCRPAAARGARRAQRLLSPGGGLGARPRRPGRNARAHPPRQRRSGDRRQVRSQRCRAPASGWLVRGLRGDGCRPPAPDRDRRPHPRAHRHIPRGSKVSAMTSVAVVGGGFAGVGAIVLLKRAGHEDVTVFDRGERVGGVWHHNTYPGAACDVASHLYEFSFAPNPRWTRRYAPQAEIQRYLEDVARDNGVPDRIRTSTEVQPARWDGERAKWLLDTSAGPHEADVLITACGQLSVPSVPALPALASFAGPTFH